jgi:hypothetical protein
MADAKITQLANNETLNDADLIAIVDDVAGTPVTEKRTFANLKAFLKTYFDTLYTNNTGTVTSVAVSGSDGIEVDSGSPITTTGTITLGVNKTSMLSHLNVADGADVTDTTNVTAAGALMDSEVDADIKTLSLPANTTISTFGASIIDDADAAAVLTTLGLTATATELNYTDGLTSAIQTQLNAKYESGDDPTFGDLTYDTATSTPVALGNLGASEAIDWSTGTHFTGTLDSDVTITHSNEVSGRKITLVLSYSGAQRTITWSHVDFWAGGAEPDAPVSGETLIVTLAFIGTTCYGTGELFS